VIRFPSILVIAFGTGDERRTRGNAIRLLLEEALEQPAKGTK